MTGQPPGKTRKNKAPFEECHPNNKTPHAPVGGVRLFPLDPVPNPATPSTSGSAGEVDSAFVFPPPPPNLDKSRKGKSKKTSELIVRTKSQDNELHGNAILSPPRPTVLSTSPGFEPKFYRQKINFNDDSPSVSQLSIGSDDQTPDSPPPPFKPPTPTRTPTLSAKSKLDSGVERAIGQDSPILLRSGGPSVSPKPASHREEKSSKASLVALAPFAAARLSLRKRKESKTTPPKEAEPDNFHNLHRKAQTSLRMAISDKVRFTNISHAVVFLNQLSH